MSTDRVRLVGTVTYDDAQTGSEDYWFDVPERRADAVSDSGDAWLACLTPLAMLLGEPLRIAAPVDRQLLKNARRLQEIWHCWYPHLRIVPVTAELADPLTRTQPARTASFFSGGVDSFFTALRHQAAAHTENVCAGDLLCVWGFDIPLENKEAFARVRARFSAVAAELDMELIDIATNIRETLWRRTNWPLHSHGAALAAVALAMGRGYDVVRIPCTESYNHLNAWGSHALTDPLFSTAQTAIEHDGPDFSRFAKLEFLADSDLALRELRVCWSSASDENCCRCEKCYRTMLALEILGVLSRCPSFKDATIRTDFVKRIYIEWCLVWDYRELEARAIKEDRKDIARAIQSAFRRSAVVTACIKAADHLKKVPFAAQMARRLERIMLSRSVK